MIKRVKRTPPQPTTKTSNKSLKHTTSRPQYDNDFAEYCPLFIIKNVDSLHNERYMLIYKKNMMCISAQNTLDKLLQSLTSMTSQHGHSMNGLINYLDNGIINSEYGFNPSPSVLVYRKQSVNDYYTKDILEAVNRGAVVNKPSKKKLVVHKRG